MRHKILFTFVLGAALGTAPQAGASWAAVPLEILIDQAEVIVEGSVIGIKPEVYTQKFGNFERKYDAAVLKVDAVLKGDKKLKEVLIAQPSMGGIGLSTDIRYAVGQTGVWMLKLDAEHKTYQIGHPSQFQPAKEKEKVVKLVKQRADLKGGKAVKGLVARAETIRHGPKHEVRFSLKNVSDKPLRINTYVGFRPLRVKWIGPEGKERVSPHYEWLKRARLRAPSEKDFVTIKPGGVYFLSPLAGGTTGIIFATTDAGKHRVDVTYVNEQDGKKHKLDNVWIGKVTSNPVTFEVK